LHAGSRQPTGELLRGDRPHAAAFAQHAGRPPRGMPVDHPERDARRGVHRGIDKAVVDPRAHPLTPTPLPTGPKDPFLPRPMGATRRSPWTGLLLSAMPDLPTPEAEAEAEAAAAEAAAEAAAAASNRT
jgi:hypothetical protein